MPPSDGKTRGLAYATSGGVEYGREKEIEGPSRSRDEGAPRDAFVEAEGGIRRGVVKIELGCELC